jgi:hypothetical protein
VPVSLKRNAGEVPDRADAGDADRGGIGIGFEPCDQFLEVGRRQILAPHDQQRLGSKLRDRLEIPHQIERQRIKPADQRVGRERADAERVAVGTARAARPTPMLPAAPATFSMMMG